MRGPHGADRRGRRSRFADRGAAAVEAAIVTPVVMAMLFGIIESGFLFKDYLAVGASVRSGVRLASAAPRTATYAQDAADKVASSGLAMNFNDIEQMWVYKVDTLTDKPVGFSTFSGCLTCVKFTWNGSAFVKIYDGWPASSQNACSSSGPDGPPDRVGVYVQLKHHALTGLVFGTVEIADASIMTFEPMISLTGCRPPP